MWIGVPVTAHSERSGLRPEYGGDRVGQRESLLSFWEGELALQTFQGSEDRMHVLIGEVSSARGRSDHILVMAGTGPEELARLGLCEPPSGPVLGAEVMASA